MRRHVEIDDGGDVRAPLAIGAKRLADGVYGYRRSDDAAEVGF
jgi:hypothetical protein